LIILVVATATTALAGCSDGAMSTKAYFAELETIAQKTDDASAAWQERTRDPLAGIASTQEATEVFRPLLEDGLEIIQTAHDELEQLSPPDEIADSTPPLRIASAPRFTSSRDSATTATHSDLRVSWPPYRGKTFRVLTVPQTTRVPIFRALRKTEGWMST
jgi:hypothetical protein